MHLEIDRLMGVPVGEGDGRVASELEGGFGAAIVLDQVVNFCTVLGRCHAGFQVIVVHIGLGLHNMVPVV